MKYINVRTYFYSLVFTCLFYSISFGQGMNVPPVGVWEGVIDTNKMEFVFKIQSDSVYGYSIIHWPNNTVIESFGGVFNPKTRKLRAVENPESKSAGIYTCSISDDGKTITGTWTRNRDGKSLDCSLNRQGSVVRAGSEPDRVLARIVTEVNNYARTRNPDLIRNVYKLWFTPEKTLGSFSDFVLGYSNTISDSLLSAEIKVNNGLYAELVLKHLAVDYRYESDDYQVTIYDTDYRLFNINGEWRIKITKVLSQNAREVVTVTKADSSRIANLHVEILEVIPPEAFAGDTVSIKIASNLSKNELNKVRINFNDSLVKIVERRYDALRVVVPLITASDTLSPVIRLTYFRPNSDVPLITSFEKFRLKPQASGSGLSWYAKGIGIFILAVLLLSIAGAIRRNIKLSREKEKLSLETEKLTQEKQKFSQISQYLGSDQEIVKLPDPEVPKELIDACKNGDCVLFTSCELSTLAGYPLMQDFIFNLINWSVDNGYLTTDQRELLISSMKAGRAEQAADSTFISLQSKGVDLTNYLSDIFLKPQPPIPEIFNYILKIPFTAAVTSNFDNLLERAYAVPDGRQGNNAKVFTHNDSEKLLSALNNRDFFILKIYGRVDEPASLILAPSQFGDTVMNNLLFSQFIENVFLSRSVFCLDANIDAIERFLTNVRFRGNTQRKHFALVGVRGRDWQASADILERRYGVEVIPYTYGDSAQMMEFVKKLAAAAPALTGTGRKRPDAPIKKVRLENIGPFEELELELDEHWNVLLGDNGVGKSTILKAIAVGIIGKDAEEYAHRLIRTGHTSGTVTLETDNGVYRTEIKSRINRAEITAYSRPLDAEGWLAVAFPPLRTVTWIKRAFSAEGSRIPLSEDILPLITGDVDPRMDRLKEWVIKLYTKSISYQKDNPTAVNKYSNLIQKFFKIVDELTPNLLLKFSKIDPISNQVLIITEDGEIPIEAISQGTLSLISWLGILVQRLYEVYGDTDEDPTKRYSLVLMDEIDAHMHPAWQRTLVHSIKGIFPNIQFIVSTHSPLVVGGMKPEQIFRFTRDSKGMVERVKISEEDTYGRTNQILTGNLFGLEVSMDVETEMIVNRYRELAALTTRTGEQEKEYLKLKKEVQKRVNTLAENPAERNAQIRLSELLKQRTSELSEDDIQETIKYLKDTKAK